MKKANPNKQTPKDPAGNWKFDGPPILSSKKHRQMDSIAALAGGIAHDYNNLLTAIIGNITLAQTYLNPDDKPFKLLHQALLASQTARNLTQKLITFSKGGSPNQALTPVERLVKNVVDFTLSGSNIKCTYNFAPDLWRINVDQSQVGQALHNVVMNAREAMPQGGHIVAAADNVALKREIPSLPAGDYVRISITDRGSGIAEADLERIFEPYYSTKSSGNQRAAGLGLSICHSIIKKHGGEVVVESQIGFGTTLTIYLPAIHADLPAKTPVKEAESTGEIFGQGKILIMDDEEMIRELAGEILRHLGYRVEFAQDGAEAVAFYEAALASVDPFDAVILDLTVRGGMGGKEAIQKLKQIDPNVRGIVSSGYSDDPGITGFKEYGFCGVVAKPYTLEELGSKLGEVLRVKPK
jgi:two-component system cell cycle sensor histidine kinase/response regulator CckA